jgi:hypothetical protein
MEWLAKWEHKSVNLITEVPHKCTGKFAQLCHSGFLHKKPLWQRGRSMGNKRLWYPRYTFERSNTQRRMKICVMFLGTFSEHNGSPVEVHPLALWCNSQDTTKRPLNSSNSDSVGRVFPYECRLYSRVTSTSLLFLPWPWWRALLLHRWSCNFAFLSLGLPLCPPFFNSSCVHPSKRRIIH